MKKEILDLSRQSKLVPIKKINEYTIKVFGVGSVGNHLVKLLAKTGFKNIEVYDMDTVDTENIAVQGFDFSHLGMNKVDAIAKIVKDGTDTEIVTNHGQVTEETVIDAEPNTIYCCVFDSFAARKIVFNKLKDMPVVFVDGRIGGFNLRHYLIDCSNKDSVISYEKTLNTGAVSEMTCGEKASAPINYQIAGKMVMNIINYIAGRTYVKRFLGNVLFPKNDIIIEEVRDTPDEPTIDEPTDTESSPEILTERIDPILASEGLGTTIMEKENGMDMQ